MLPCNSAKARLRRVVCLLAALLCVGAAYAVFCQVTGLGIPCVFRRITGFQCPGCGVSRMCLNLLKGDFAAAWRSNPVILCLLPLGAAVAADYAARYVKYGIRRPSLWANVATWLMIALLLIFGVVRNLSQ